MEELPVDFGADQLYEEEILEPNRNKDGSKRKAYEPIEDAEALDILQMLETGIERGHNMEQMYKYIARMQGRSPVTIRYFLKRLRSTRQLAQMKLEAGLSKIVDRVIEKASTGELIDVLSRPNIGILEPAKAQSQGGGFVLSVQASTCGTVVNMAGGVHGQVAQLPADPAIENAAHVSVIDRAFKVPQLGSGRPDREGQTGDEERGHEEPDGGGEHRPGRREASGPVQEPDPEKPTHYQPGRLDPGRWQPEPSHPQHGRVQRPHVTAPARSLKKPKKGRGKIHLDTPHEAFEGRG